MKRNADRVVVGFLAVCLCIVLMPDFLFAGGDTPPKETFFKIEELGSNVALNGGSFYDIHLFGPTGLAGWMLNDNLIVREVDKSSPSDGMMFPNDVIRSVNGKPLGDSPLKTLGEQIIVSEETGLLSLNVLRDNKAQTVVLKINRMPPLAKSWPYDCAKSKQILNNAARYIASQQNPAGKLDTSEGTSLGLAGLVLLASDEPEYLQSARNLTGWLKDYETITDVSENPWYLGYMGTFMAEYYLKTGDRSVLPVCQGISDRIAKMQDPRGSWTHGAPGNYWYVQGGIMNPAGASCWLALELFEECGIYQKKTLDLTRHFFMRFVDNGTVPYGDHHPEFSGTGNSKDALTGLALYVMGDQKNAELFGRIVTDFPEARVLGHTGGFLGYVWGNVAGAYNPHRPDYLRCLNHWNWMLHVGRRWDGGFLLPGNVIDNRYMLMGPVLNTGGAAMMYGVPGKSLRIFGKPESVFSTMKLNRSLEQGKELYQKLDFDGVRKLVKTNTEQGKQLLRATDMKEKDIALSLKAASSALEDMNPVRAKTIAVSLDAMCGGRVVACKELIAKANSDKYKSIFQAEKAYEENRLQVFATPEGRKGIEKIATDEKAGVYQTIARDLLNKSPDASEWVYSSELLYTKYWAFRDSNTVALAMINRLANIKTSNWTQWHPMRWLRANGHIKDTFLDEWTAILPCSGLSNRASTVEYVYYPVEPVMEGGKEPGFLPAPPADWMNSGFDDSKWRRANGPYTNKKDSNFKRIHRTKNDFYRIKFNLPDAEFSDWKLYIQRQKSAPVVVYLNGKCVAWLESARNNLHNPYDLLPGALKYLVKGENVLAVRVTACDEVFDIGIYGKKK